MNGIILLDKPAGITSFGAISAMRKILNMKKIGHAGTLDPMATGVLPILAGSAARFLEYLPCSDKRYTALIKLGYVTDTLDTTGEIKKINNVHVSLGQIESALEAFRGNISQIPPMFSAVQKDGVRMYDLARKGLEIDRESRNVKIYSLRLLDYDVQNTEITLDISCSKGTYIRTLASDLGEKLGCGACLSGLRRTMASGFKIDNCYSLEELKEYAAENRLEKRVIPIEDALAKYSAIYVSGAQAKRFSNGGELDFKRLKEKFFDGEYYRVFADNGDFLGLGKPDFQSQALKAAKVYVK